MHTEFTLRMSSINLFSFNTFKLDQNKVKHYLMRQDNTIYIFVMKLFLSSIGQNKSKLQSKLLILIAMPVLTPVLSFYLYCVHRLIASPTSYIIFIKLPLQLRCICFCIFDLSCPILEKDSFIEILYIVLSCLIK